MADGKVLLEVVVEGKNVKIVQREVEQVTDAVNENTNAQNRNSRATRQNAASANEAAKAHEHFDRGLKGSAGASSNGTKNFSKMRDVMGGSSGLVGAYATLAANLFAATAAFSALQRAAQVEQLTQGLQALGQATGVSMMSLSKGLQEATGYAISLQDSMRQVSQVTSAGFDPSIIERLGTVAKNTSIALGRDMQDSMNRLVKGAVKLEPELLDELGIMVRIDEASQKYAQSIGKNATQLTNFEKRQAFMNAVLAEGEQKFGAIGDSVDANPYDKLSATLQELGTTVLNFFNTVLGPVAGFFAESKLALAGFIGILSKGIISQALPVLSEMANATARLAVKTSQEADAAKEAARIEVETRKSSIASLEGVLGKRGAAIDSALEEANSLQELSKVQGTVNRSIAARQALEDKNAGSQTAQLAALKAYKAELQLVIEAEARRIALAAGGEEPAIKARTDLLVSGAERIGSLDEDPSIKNYASQFSGALDDAKQFREDMQGQLQGIDWGTFQAQVSGAANRALGYIVNFGIASGNALSAFRARLTGTGTSTAITFQSMTAAVQRAGVAFTSFGVAAKIAIKGIFTAIPFIGQVLFFLDLLIQGVTWLFGLLRSDEGKAYSDSLDKASEATKELATNSKEVNMAVLGSSKSITTQAQLIDAQSNIVSTASSEFNKLKTSQESAAAAGAWWGTSVSKITDNLNSQIESNSLLQKEFQNFTGQTGQSYSNLNEYIKENNLTEQEGLKISEQFLEFADKKIKAQQNLAKSVKDTNDAFTQYINKLKVTSEYTALREKLSDSVKALKSAENATEGFVNTLTLVQGLSDQQLKFYGIKEASDSFKEVNKQAQALRTLDTIKVKGMDQKDAAIAVNESLKALGMQEIDISSSQKQIEEARLKVLDKMAGRKQIIFDTEKKLSDEITKRAEEEQKIIIELDRQSSAVKHAQEMQSIQNDLIKEQGFITKANAAERDRLQIESFAKQSSLLALEIKEAERYKNLQNEGTIEREQAEARLSELRSKNNLLAFRQEKFINDAGVRTAEDALANLEKRLAGEKQLISILEKQAQLLTSNLGLEEQIAESRIKLQNLTSGGTGELAVDQQLKLLKDFEDRKAANAKREYDLKIRTINLEEKIAKAQLAVATAQLTAIVEQDRKSRDIRRPDYNSNNIMFTEEESQNLNNLLSELRTAAAENITGVTASLQKKDAQLQYEDRIVKDQIKTAEVTSQYQERNYTLAIDAAQQILSANESIEEVYDRINSSRSSILDSQRQVTENELKAINLRERGKYELTAQQTLELETDFANKKAALIKEEESRKLRMIALEFKLLEAQTRFQQYQAKTQLQTLKDEATRRGDAAAVAEITSLAADLDSAFTQVIAQIPEAAKLAQEELVSSTKAALSDLDASKLIKDRNTVLTTTVQTIMPEAGQLFDPKAFSESIGMARKGAMQDQLGPINDQMKSIEEQRAKLLDSDVIDLGKYTELGNKLKELNNQRTAISTGEDPFANIKMGIAGAGVALAPFIESLKTLGPQGELVASIASGTLVMADSISKFAESSKTAADKFALVGAVVSSVASIIGAASQAKIAGIDAEINAEKQRDGKSRESLARIASMEKKKEGAKRKAFETNKKMMMATTIINTAAAAMAAWAPPPTGAGPLFGGALTAMIVALGAAQLGIIAGMSYEGGGGSISAATPSTVSLGQRKSSIDMAKSQSAAGELGYLQGDKGVGGPENFRPAFIGSRAAGGRVNAGYMVGEQGPELFVPKIPGRIVPADKVNNAPAQNVNISITALDASGVEEVLVKQRGHIIGMIREAANSYGEKFLETVDTSVYTQPSKGYGVARA